jgi:hypothetical protein
MGGVRAIALEAGSALARVAVAAFGAGFGADVVWAEVSVAKARMADESDAITRMTFVS